MLHGQSFNSIHLLFDDEWPFSCAILVISYINPMRRTFDGLHAKLVILSLGVTTTFFELYPMTMLAELLENLTKIFSILKICHAYLNNIAVRRNRFCLSIHSVPPIPSGSVILPAAPNLYFPTKVWILFIVEVKWVIKEPGILRTGVAPLSGRIPLE